MSPSPEGLFLYPAIHHSGILVSLVQVVFGLGKIAVKDGEVGVAHQALQGNQVHARA